jgi:hypothetical protein
VHRRTLRFAPVRRVRGGGRPAPSTRPILRPELFDQLEERMDQLMLDKLAWR